MRTASPHAMTIVKSTAPALEKHGVEITTAMYARLFRDPAIEALFARDLWVPAIRPPTVPVGSARLRVSLSAAHSFAQIDELISALRERAANAGDSGEACDA